ncbi:MAG TPA: hypothetical protein PLS28_00645 [Clostridiales bacterium]|nr:hypothetical protein [Clostridiales bacterium]
MVTVYYIIKLITAPGALLKGFLEHLFCRIFKVPVEYAEYLQRSALCGHVEHFLAPKKGSFGICYFPHLIMLLLGLAISLPAGIKFFYFGTFGWAELLLFYVALCLLTNCFPLMEDAVNMWEKLYGEDASSKTVVKVLLSPFAVILYGGAWLEQYGLTLLLGLLEIIGLPYLLALIVG